MKSAQLYICEGCVAEACGSARIDEHSLVEAPNHGVWVLSEGMSERAEPCDGCGSVEGNLRQHAHILFPTSD